MSSPQEVTTFRTPNFSIIHIDIKDGELTFDFETTAEMA